jgi:putative cardiolipin synthase
MPPAETPLWNDLAKARPGDWLRILNTGDQSLDWRLRAIDSATRSIDLQTFLWHDDKAGLSILRHLVAAADRGVRVRLLVDDTFTVSHAEEIWDVDHSPNIEYRIYNPFQHRPDSQAMRQLLNIGEFGRVDHRMHNKSLIVDNRVAVIGGRNLGDEYFGSHDEFNFRDMDLLCGGPHVVDLSKLFDRFWNNRWSVDEEVLIKSPRDKMSHKVFNAWLKANGKLRISESPEKRRRKWLELSRNAVPATFEVVADIPAPHDPSLAKELPNQLSKRLIKLLDQAEKEIILVTAYLIPTREFEDAVERAEKRGVQVRVLTNSIRSNNHLAAHSFYRKHLHRLVGHGADVHEVRTLAKDRHLYMETPIGKKKLGLHAKFIIVDDDQAYVGSSNLDARSLKLNTEMGLVIRSGSFNRRLRNLIATDFHPRNAWHLQMSKKGRLRWVGDDITLDKQPAGSRWQSIEDWFLGLLPAEGEL